MYKKTALITTILILTAIQFLQAQPDHPTGDSLAIKGLSKDGKHVAIEECQSMDGYGGPSPCTIQIIDTISGETIDTIVTSKGGPEMEDKWQQLGKINSELKKAGQKALIRRGLTIQPTPSSLPDELRIRFARTGMEDGFAVISFYLVQTKTNKSYHIGEGNQAAPDLTSLSIGDIYASPDEKTFFIYYHRSSVMEFDPGTTGLLIVNKYILSQINNATGYSFYKKKNYSTALSYFKKALLYDDANITALYNAACMCALLKDVDKTISYLDMLKKIGNEKARAKLQKVKKDRDYNGIRKNKKFMKYMSGVK